MSFFNELKRRNVFKVGIAYIIVAWLVLQVSDTLVPALHLPEWFHSGVAFVLIIGFPIAMIFAWAFEMTPEGLKKEKEVDRTQSITNVTSQKLNNAIIGVLVLALGYFAIDKFVLDLKRDAELVKVTQSAIEPAQDIAPESLSKNSIAVLPFVNMSDDASNEYFSEGLSEELLNLLGKIPQLRVAARTSSFSYKGTGTKIAQIGAELSVAHVLEGSVRKSGNRVRITAQLIKTDDGFDLWSETFDRELTAENIFAIQREMATSIARELRATLSLQEIARLGALPTQSTTAHDLYVKGRYFWNKRTKEGFDRALEYFNQAIKEDPNYALAYAGIASIYVVMGNELYAWSLPRDAYPKAQAAAQRALKLDDTLAEAHSTLGDFHLRYDWDFISAAREHQLAIALNPNNATGHQWYSHFLLPMGRDKESLAHSLKALELDPLNLIINLHLGWHYFYVGENELAIEQLQQTLELSSTFVVANLFLGQVYEQEMRFEEAIEQFERAADLSGRNPVYLAALAHAYGISGRQKDAETLLREMLSSEQFVPSYEIAVIYAGLDRQDEALTWLERAYEKKDSSWLVDVALDPRFQQLHSTSRFQSLAGRLGLP